MSRPMRWLLWFAIAALLVLAGWSWWSGGVVFDMLRTDWDSARKVARLRDYFAGWGLWAPVIYVGFVTVEVLVAPLPGLILYIPGGMIFGPLLGGALALIGNMAGAGLACGLVRSVRGAQCDRFFSEPKRQRIQQQIETRGGWLIFWLRLNPLTSTDLVSYAAGFTRIPIRQVVLATGLGIAPLCFIQAALSDSVFRKFPQLIYPLIGVCAVYLVAAIMLVRRTITQYRA